MAASVWLASCPFCGSGNIEVANTWTPSYWGECLDCHAQGAPSGILPAEEAAYKITGGYSPSALKRGRADAIAAWNRRMPHDPFMPPLHWWQHNPDARWHAYAGDGDGICWAQDTNPTWHGGAAVWLHAKGAGRASGLVFTPRAMQELGIHPADSLRRRPRGA